MCGIVGYTGPREAGPILIEGLRRLEYRGYDSAGIALVDEQGDLFVEKKAGKLANLQADPRSRTGRRTRPSGSRTRAGRRTGGRTISTPIPTRTARATSRSSTTGSSRTSATCGTGSGPRPHAHVGDGHGGDRAPRRGGLRGRPRGRRVRATLRQLQALAVVVMHKREQSRLVGARKDVPLVVGLHGEESFIASDVAAILAHTNRIIFLADGDVADVRPTSVEITGVDGVPRHRNETLVDSSPKGRREGRLRPLHAQGDPRAAGRAARSLADRVTADASPARRGRGCRRCVPAATTSISSPAAPRHTPGSVGAVADPALPAAGPRCRSGSEFRYSAPR